MKKTKKALLAVLACSALFAGVFGLAACKNGDDSGSGGQDTHSHNYVNWQSDGATTHTGTCEDTDGKCDAKTKTEEHDTDGENGACSKCDYKAPSGDENDEHAHGYSYTPNNDGTHNGTCADTDGKCDAKTVTNQVCDTDGEDGACSKCGYTAQGGDEKDEHAHSYSYTSNNDGTHNGTCADTDGKCDAKTVTNQVCDTDGEDGACSKCGYTASAPAPTHEHDWNDWTLTEGNKPTAEETGKLTRTCKNEDCDATVSDKEFTLPVLSSEDYSKSNDSATCTEAGTATYTYNKGGVNVSFEAETTAKGHTEKIIPQTYPTCTETGLTEGKKCSDCGEILEAQDTINATGHTESTLPAVEATCTEDGSTEGKKCAVCQEVLEAQTVIKATGHKLSTTATPTVNETAKTVSQRCTVCNKLVVYKYDNVVNAASTAFGSPDVLSDGVNYVIQSGTRNYLSYTFEEAGTYSIYWVNLNRDKLSLTNANLTTSSSNGFIKSSSVQNSYLVDGLVFEGYNKGTSEYKYNLTDEEGNLVLDGDGKKVVASVQPGDYASLRLIKNNVLTASLSGFSIEKLTFEAAANSTIKLNINDEEARYLISIGKEETNKKPTIFAEYSTVGEGDFAVKDSELEFTPVTEAGTYTFTAENGKFELYVNDEKYSDGTKDYFGYVTFSNRYLTVTLQAGDVVKVVKVAGRASDNIVSITEGELEEPEAPEYNTLETGSNTITLTDMNISTGKYEDATEKFYIFTAPESGYYEISVADDVTVGATIKEDREHYFTIFDVSATGKHSGVFYAEAGETIVIAFVGNGSLEFAVNIAPGEEPITYLNVNETINVTFSSFVTIVKLTVGDSVAEGTYTISFEVPNSMKRSYIYFSVNNEIVVEDKYNSNGVTYYISADIAAGANHTVGAGTRGGDDDSLEVKEFKDFTRTVTLKAGDVIYLATDSLTSGYADITLMPVTEVE